MTSMPLSLCSVESSRSAKRGGWGDESREAGLALMACLADSGRELRLGDPLRPADMEEHKWSPIDSHLSCKSPTFNQCHSRMYKATKDDSVTFALSLMNVGSHIHIYMLHWVSMVWWMW